jgi:hypothetical protein
MSGTASCATARPYGVKLLCRTWEQPRSSFRANRQAAELPVRVTPPGKRGPKTALSDAQLLELIRADLAASPFQGEGHRQDARLMWEKVPGEMDNPQGLVWSFFSGPYVSLP